MSRTPTQRIDYTSKDYEAFRNMMLKSLGIKMPEYTDLRQSDAGVVILELLAQGLDILSYYQDTIANEVFLSTEEQRDNALKWCQMLGYTPRNSSPARFKQVFVLSSAQDTPTTIPQGTVVKTVVSSIEPEIKFETEEDLIIPAGKLGNEKDSDGNYLYTVSIVQGSSVVGELLGTSNESANQKFILNYSPVVVDSVTVIINEGSGFEKWKRVDNFVDSLPDSRHYTVEISDNDEAVITFGDGVFGKIPTKYDNGMFCNYRVGGGEKGNVGANKITVLDSNIALVAETFNPDTAYENGHDKESLDEIKINAPLVNRTIWGALTADDFAGIVKVHFPDIVLSASKVDETNPDNIHIYVYLKDDKELTDEYISEVLELFDENKGGRKIVGADVISIEYANFTPIDLSCSLTVKADYKKSDVEDKIKQYLTYYFKKGNYSFNQELSLTELSANIMNPYNMIEGIKSFKFTSPSDDILTPASGEIFTLGTVTFTTTGGIE